MLGAMTAAIRGLGITFVAFALAFGLHIVGGATDQGWLFAIAVGLIFAIATGFPAIALWLSGLAYQGSDEAKFTYTTGIAIGTGLTLGALWAANEREFAWWHFPASILLVASVSAVILLVRVRVETGKLPEKRRNAIS
jgi:heme/copper-type cytochrome/quinol oxidase subunit 4